MKTKKLLSIILALVMAFSLSTTAFAAWAPPSIDESGGNESVPVTLNVEPAIFSVTVPSVLPVSVTADGEVVCAESGEARIINYSHGAVKVTNLEIDAINGWETVDFDNANMHKVAVNSRLFAFTINEEKTTGADAITFDEANFPVLDGANDTDSDELVIDYDALVAPQNAAISDIDIANIVFTIAWEELESPLKLNERYIMTNFFGEIPVGGYIEFKENGAINIGFGAEFFEEPENSFKLRGSEILNEYDEVIMVVSSDGKTLTAITDGNGVGELKLESEIEYIQFTIDGKQYQAIDGNTWVDFIYSVYNIEFTEEDAIFEYDIASNDDYIKNEFDHTIADENDVDVYPTDIIVNNGEYFSSERWAER